MTRPIELSKNQKTTRDAFIDTLSSSVGDASQIYLFTQLFYVSQRLAQVQLQAWEAHLAAASYFRHPQARSWHDSWSIRVLRLCFDEAK